MRRLFCLLPIFVPALVLAQGRAAQHRLEAHAEVKKVLSGGNPQAALARLHYLGEEHYAAAMLTRAWEEITAIELRRNVAQVVAGLKDPSAERFLMSLAASDDSALRMSAAEGLGRLGSKKVEVLFPLLSDPSLGVRREAARALGVSHLKKVGRPLIRAAMTEGEPEVRAAMLVAAGQSGDRRIAPQLASFLTHSSESARLASAQGLCLLGDPKGFAYAKTLLESEDRYTRRQGVALFEGLPAKQSKPYLEPRLRDPDKHVSAAAARILYQGGDASMLDWLVLASHLSRPEDKLIFEAELERLMLTDERRKEILRQAGVVP
ncbi:MAG: HEAT repeat domain-containing protein [Myxococcaceae bacterium]|nr:HEAT repeat domain-containing protein [Myxococcaceae bacterium]